MTAPQHPLLLRTLSTAMCSLDTHGTGELIFLIPGPAGEDPGPPSSPERVERVARMLLDNPLAVKIVKHWNTVVSPEEHALRFVMRALGGYNTVTSPRCRIRVPDNCDFVDCGKPTIRGDLCGEHLKRAILVTEENLLKAERLKDAYRRRLQALKGEAPWTDGEDCRGVQWPLSWGEDS